MENAGSVALAALAVGFIIAFTVITGFAYSTLLERKVLARMQARVGPNRAGYIPIPRRGKKELRLLGGVMQPLADAVKLFMKEDTTPLLCRSSGFITSPLSSQFCLRFLVWL